MLFLLVSLASSVAEAVPVHLRVIIAGVLMAKFELDWVVERAGTMHVALVPLVSVASVDRGQTLPQIVIPFPVVLRDEAKPAPVTVTLQPPA